MTHVDERGGFRRGVFAESANRLARGISRGTTPGSPRARVRPRRTHLVRSHGAALAVIALGGGLGSLARYGVSRVLPARPGEFPWGTFAVNVLGCFLVGVLMVLIGEVWSAHRLVRPFLGVGVLGGFTTFSTYANEARALLAPGSAGTALAYLFGTLLCAMLAVLAGVWLTRAMTARPA